MVSVFVTISWLRTCFLMPGVVHRSSVLDGSSGTPKIVACLPKPLISMTAKSSTFSSESAQQVISVSSANCSISATSVNSSKILD